MTHRFGDFELDEIRHELRLRGREIVLQPRIFELLVYLVHNRERLVPKEELLEALWPDVVVGDGALQRAVSLARSALRQGGLADAIRTHARVGYSFRAELRASAVAASPAAAPAEAAPAARTREDLERGRRAFDDSDWEAAMQTFAEADRGAALEGADLERWAMACQYGGRLSDAVAPLERAVAAHCSAGDRRGAARAAIQLANIQLERREGAVAQGWRNRAATLLSTEDEGREHGFLAWITSRIAIFCGDMEEGRRQADLAHTIGQRLEDPEIEALGLLYRGLTLLALGELEQGVPLQDEAAATVLSGQVGPWAGGLIYCAVIWGCLNRADWQRANQWTDQFTRWCARSGVAPFPGLCRLHRAEVLTLRGQLEEAEGELLSLQRILQESAPYAEGDLHRVLGEVRLARGDLNGADEAFRRAYELGWDPQPGRALLQVRQGKAGAALKALQRSLEDPSWSNRQRRAMLLAYVVLVAVAAGELDRAREALAELDAHAAFWDTPALQALVCHGRAELAFADGANAEAIARLRRAVQIWQEVGSPLQAAELRVRLAELLRADGDPETAELELGAAERAFAAIGLPAGGIRKS